MHLGRVLEEIEGSNHALDRASRGRLLTRAALENDASDRLATRQLQLLELKERVHVAHEGRKVTALLQLRHASQSKTLRRHTRI